MLTPKRYKVTITKNNLNVRNGAGYDKAIVKTATPGTYDCKEIKDGWAKIGKNEWVCTDFVTLEEIVPEIKTMKKENEIDE